MFYKKLEEGLDNIKKEVQKMVATTSGMLENVKDVIKSGDLDLADKVILKDERVDQLNNKIIEDCTILIAKYQPKARDLKNIIAYLHMIIDIERAGDHCVKICKDFKNQKHPFKSSSVSSICKMIEVTQKMLDMAITAFINKDLKLSQKVIDKDDKIDEYRRDVVSSILVKLRKELDTVDKYMFILNAIRRIERIADHATNVADLTEYVTE